MSALLAPGALPEDGLLSDMLRSLEPGWTSPVNERLRSLFRALDTASAVPPDFISRLMSLVSDQGVSPPARLRLLWLLDACAARVDHLLDFASVCLERESSREVRLHLLSHTIPAALLDGPVSAKSRRFRELFESTDLDDALPGIARRACAWDPQFVSRLSSCSRARLERAEKAAVSRMVDVGPGGVFCADRWAASFVSMLPNGSTPEGIIESMVDGDDYEIRLLLSDALAGWPEDIDSLIESELDRVAWDSSSPVAGLLQAALDRRSVTRLLAV